MKAYIEERAIEAARYIIEQGATVRQAAKELGISKSTVHMVVTKQNGQFGMWGKWKSAECWGICTFLMLFLYLFYLDTVAFFAALGYTNSIDR